MFVLWKMRRYFAYNFYYYCHVIRCTASVDVTQSAAYNIVAAHNNPSHTTVISMSERYWLLDATDLPLKLQLSNHHLFRTNEP